MQDHVVTGARRIEGAQTPQGGEALLRRDVAEQSHPIVEPEVVEPERRRAEMRHAVLLIFLFLTVSVGEDMSRGRTPAVEATTDGGTSIDRAALQPAAHIQALVGLRPAVHWRHAAAVYLDTLVISPPLSAESTARAGRRPQAA